MKTLERQLSTACKNCDSRCCTSKYEKLFVILIPKEEKRFGKYSRTIKTKYRSLKVLKTNRKRECIFLDSKKHNCKIYKNRPFECKVYPCFIYYDKKHRKVIYKADKKICPFIRHLSQKQLEYSLKEKQKKWLKQHLPLDWIKAYLETP